MISNLPHDLIEEILSRFPLKSMRAVRLSCKNWNALSKSPSFAKMHIDKAPTAESQKIVMMDYNLYLMGVVVDREPELKTVVTCLDEQVKISQVFHCEGLLLCILKEDDTKVLVWNPYCSQKMWIETRFSRHGRGDSGWLMERYIYAIGYANKKDKSCRSYKILRFFDDSDRLPSSSKLGDQFFWYEIYDFDSGLWTTLEVSPHWRITFHQLGVSVKGNTYWYASERNSRGFDNSIICFDFTSERFGPHLSIPVSPLMADFITLSCVREEKLAVVRNNMMSYEIEIWVTTTEKIDWSKLLKLGSKAEYEIAAWSFFIDEEKKVVMGFHKMYATWMHQHKLSIVGEDGYLRKLNLGMLLCSKFSANQTTYRRRPKEATKRLRKAST